MLEELISKKDLLEELKISYGQLYRWKRKKLIPEEWFIKKSVSTGQETYFPKQKIISRINRIIELKDDISLDDLANQFSYNIKNIKLKKIYLEKNHIIPSSIMERFENVIKIDEEIYDENALFTLFIYDDLINAGFYSIEEINEIIMAIYKNYLKINSEDNVLIIKRKFGICFYYVISGANEIPIDENSKEIGRFSIKKILEKIQEVSIIN